LGCFVLPSLQQKHLSQKKATACSAKHSSQKKLQLVAQNLHLKKATACSFFVCILEKSYSL
jgi:hypothetical protein